MAGDVRALGGVRIGAERLVPDLAVVDDESTQEGVRRALADLAKADILDAMKHDKKMIAGRLQFVLPTAIGATAIVDDVTEKEMKEALIRVGFKK